MKKLTFRLALLSLLIGFSAQSQIFTSTGGMRQVNAASVGHPNVANGQVRTKAAPAGNGNVNSVKNTLNAAGINAGIYNNARVLGNGGYASQIASLSAMKKTANALNARPATAPTNGATVISNASQLANNRNIIQDNSTRAIVFRGNINVPFPILVGSNKTIWIDGTLNYNGVNVVPEGGAAFTPRPLKNDGVFSVRHPGNFRRTFPNQGNQQQPNMDFNRNLRNTVVKPNGKTNVTFRGTKRGKIVVQLGPDRDDKQNLPKANGIAALNSNNLTIDGVNIIGALNAIYSSGGFNLNIRNCFTDATVYRGIHLHGTQSNRSNSSFGVIKHNFLAFNKFDGIDVDSFSAGFLIEENVVIGARDRYLVWIEIDAENNVINNNLGIILGNTAGTRSGGAGGFHENGTEASRRGTPGFEGTNNNDWTNNHSFYVERERDGFIMIKARFIQFNTINFENNYVWSLNANVPKHNPKPNKLTDVYYLTGTGGGGTPPTGGGGSVVTMRKGTTNFGLDGNNGGANGQNVYIWSRNTSNVNQQWEEIDRGGGFYSYQKKNTNFCLDGGNGGANGQNVYLWTRNDSNQNQHWRKVPVAGGRFRLEKRNAPGFSIDAGNGGANGQNIYLWASNNNNVNQQWDFGSVSANARVSLADLSGSTTNNLIDIKVYPNPLRNSETLYVDTDATKVNLQLVDLAGRVIHSTNQKSINFRTINMARGIYLLQINADDIRMVEKIAIE